MRGLKQRPLFLESVQSMFSFVVFSLFVLLVLAPCLVAVTVTLLTEDTTFWQLDSSAWNLPRRMGRMPRPLNTAGPELQPTDQFRIRSFPKGLAVRAALNQRRQPWLGWPISPKTPAIAIRQQRRRADDTHAHAA